MVQYYCPYCNPKYQFQKQSSNGTLICGLCGEDLIKKPFIRLNQIIAERAAVLANMKKQIATAKVNAQRAATIEAQKKIEEAN